MSAYLYVAFFVVFPSVFFCIHCFSAAEAPYLAQNNEHITLCLTLFILKTSDLFKTSLDTAVTLVIMKCIAAAKDVKIVFLCSIHLLKHECTNLPHTHVQCTSELERS